MLAILAGAVALEAAHGTGSVAAADFVAGSSLVVCGALAWQQRRTSRVGPLLGLAGIGWFLGTAASPLLYVHRGPLTHAILSSPAGRLRSRFAQVVVAGAWLDGAIEPLARNGAVTLVLAAAIALAGIYRNGGAELAFAAVLVLGAWNANLAVLWTYDLVIAGLAVALLVELLRGNRAAVAGLVVELGAEADGATLQRKLGRTLGDPSLVVGYRVEGMAGFVDEAGRHVPLPTPGSGRAVTQLVDDGEQIGILLHDAALLADRALVNSVAAAARIAVANAALQARARAQADELQASRRRIVEAADRQRRQIRAELDRSAGRALDAVASLLAATGSPAVGQLKRELDETRRELARFAHGVRPTVLTQHGLVPALAQLAERSPIPVTIRGEASRLAEPVEAALFFVCSEALANVAKHAGASAATLAVQADKQSVTVEIADDGRGGADANRGSGLAGLVDRVEALGGRLAIESPNGAGTRVTARVPLSEHD